MISRNPLPAWCLLFLCVLLLVVSPGTRAQDDPEGKGTVTLPATDWLAQLRALDQAQPSPGSPVPFMHLDRRLEGSFRKGVFSGVLTVRFVVPAPGGDARDIYVRVPVLDARTSLDEVRLDGQPTSLLPEGGMYTVGIVRPGEHTVQIRFFQGREDLRFSRKLQVALPPSGPTAVSVQVPETDIEASLSRGAITAVVPADGGTRIVGALDASGDLDLTWKREATHQATAAVKTEASVHTVLTLHEALVKGVASFDFTVREGETDRIGIRLPPEVEVLDVTGDDVLQWFPTTEAGESRTTVLLRFLAESSLQAAGQDHARMRVHFQFPGQLDTPFSLHQPLPLQGVPFTGSMGLVGPAGLQVDVAHSEKAEVLTLRDIPPDLSDLSSEPLLAGFSFTEPPAISIQVSRNQELDLTSTVVDDVQATTQLLEDGTEIMKMRLRMRNNTRQYLQVDLPLGMVLTHAFVDGAPIQPALQSVGDEKKGDTLLFPLRQSVRVGQSARRSHIVQPGETLMDLAVRYYGDPSSWNEILTANPHLADVHLEAGTTLVIPMKAEMAEAGFFIELACIRARRSMGLVGSQKVTLPRLDVDTMSLTWHLYLPEHLAPLAFQANLTRYSALRYDPIRRLLQFMDSAMHVRKAWAGGSYQSILGQRRTIYFNEGSRQWKSGQEVAGSFPYVGRPYRFQRILAGQDVPRIRVTWIPLKSLPFVRVGAFLASLAIFLGFLRGGGRRRLFAILGGIALLVLAWHVNGVHRRMLWGLDAALAWQILRESGPLVRDRLSRRFGHPGAILDLITVRNALILAAVAVAGHLILISPLLLSTWVLVTLLVARRLGRKTGAGAVAVLGLVLAFGVPSVQAGEMDEDIQRQQFADDNFNAIMQQNEVDRGGEGKQRPARSSATTPLPAAAIPEAPKPTTTAEAERGISLVPAQAVVPLWRYEEIQARLDAVRMEQARSSPPLVVLGASSFDGEAIPGSLHMNLELGVTLAGPDQWKVVPLVGQEVVVVKATTRSGQSVPLSSQNGYHVWITRESGEFDLRLEILVPSRGPRGSLEYDFLVAKTPVTRFRCSFPTTGLEPRLRGAVRAEVSTLGGGTQLAASLEPTSRIRLVGYKEVSADEGRKARIYAETTNLLSIGEGAIDLFSVVRYNILYAGVQHFEVQIPVGLTVVSADGEGAFRYSVEPAADGTSTLVGETAFPIRNGYEISLRLRGSLPDPENGFEVILPRSIGVEREQGWLAVEILGNLKLEERDRVGAQNVDVRQLPAEVVESAVSPILKAYRYPSPDARLRLTATELPEREPASGTVDRLRVTTTVAAEGTVLSEITITLRNRMRHHLSLRLPPGMEVRSALLDGQPVKPATAPDGSLILPLKRSPGGDQPRPFSLQLVVEGKQSALWLAGWRSLSLPIMDMPASAVTWSVYLPPANLYSGLRGDVEPQTLDGNASWIPAQATPDSGVVTRVEPAESEGESQTGSGALPVRIEVPKTGRCLTWTRYWLNAGQPVEVGFCYLRHWLRPFILLAMLGGLGLAITRFSLNDRGRWGIAAAGIVFAASMLWLSGWGLVVLAMIFAAIRLGRKVALWSRFKAWYRTPAPDGPSTWRDGSTGLKLIRVLSFSLSAFLAILALARLCWILGHPLHG